MNNKHTYRNAKVNSICEILGKVIVYIIAITVCIGILSAAVWGAQQIFRCIENILCAVLFFAAVALGG